MNTATKITTISVLSLAIMSLGMISPASAQTTDEDNHPIRNYLQKRLNNADLTDEQKEAFKQKGRKRYGYWKTWKQDITKTVEKIDRGVVVTYTTDNEDLVERLHNREFKKSTRDDITVTKTNLENGIQVAYTSDNLESIAKLHKRADNHNMKQSITRNVEKTDNGAQVTITGDTDAAVAFILDRERKDLEHPEVTKTITELDNGVVVSIASDNSDMVARIQKRAERRHYGKKLGNFKKFNRKFDRAKENSQPTE